MLTVFVLLALAAFILTLCAAVNRCPLWVAVLVLSVLEMLRALPLGR